MRYLGIGAHPETREGRERLTARAPHVEMLLVGLNIDEADIAKAREFAKACWSERNRWDVSRRGVGMFGSTSRLSRQDADRELRRQFASLDCGGHYA